MSQHEDHPHRLRFRGRPQPASGSAVLVLLAHPTLHRSRANRRMAEAARGVPGVTVHDLYDAYPDFDIDIEAEKALLLAHEVIVFQHPFYWYSTPALLKQWQDLVLEFGWAYGPGGEALKGKRLLHAMSCGGQASAYQPEGFNRFSVRELLAPSQQTAYLCKMRWLAPFVIYGVHRLEEGELDAAAGRYRAALEALRDGRIDLERAEAAPTFEAAFTGEGR